MVRSGRDSAHADVRLVRLGANVRNTRQRIGLSQAALAARAGVSQGQVSRIESGAREAGILTVLQVAHALEVRLADLVRGTIR